MNPDEVKKRKWKLIYYCVLDASKAAWCNECEADRVGNYTRRGLRSSCHSNYRYLHQRGSSIVS